MIANPNDGKSKIGRSVWASRDQQWNGGGSDPPGGRWAAWKGPVR